MRSTAQMCRHRSFSPCTRHGCDNEEITMTRMLKYTLVVGATLFTIMGLATVPAQAIDPPQIRPIARPVIYPRGLEVTRVAPGSPAALAGLERGDVIIAVDRQGVRSPEEL